MLVILLVSCQDLFHLRRGREPQKGGAEGDCGQDRGRKREGVLLGTRGEGRGRDLPEAPHGRGLPCCSLLRESQGRSALQQQGTDALLGLSHRLFQAFEALGRRPDLLGGRACAGKDRLELLVALVQHLPGETDGQNSRAIIAYSHGGSGEATEALKEAGGEGRGPHKEGERVLLLRHSPRGAACFPPSGPQGSPGTPQGRQPP